MNVYDLVIKNGTLVIPERQQIITANLGITGDKIAIITNDDIRGLKEIDAMNKIVSPGFVDVHGHIDGHLEVGKLAAVQGITTTVGGNCGLGHSNLREFFDAQQAGFIINQAQLVGHSFSLREEVGIENPYSAADDIQIKEMSHRIERAFNEGAIGLSFGIEYAPGSSYKEIMELSSIAARYGRIIPIHTNVDNPNSLKSLEDAIAIAKVTGAHVLISHFVYQYGTGVMEKALELVDKARQDGLKISVDSGMYTSFATHIGSAIYDKSYMKKMGWTVTDLVVASGKYRGRRMDEKLYKEVRENYRNESAICFTGVEAEIYEALRKDYVMVSTDIGPSLSGSTKDGHPQNAGTFPRFFRKMVRERKELTLLDAVRKCTLLPADTFGFDKKGRLSEGCDADIVIFDIDNIRDNAWFPNEGEPDAKPDGIEYVIVSGKIIVEKGSLAEDILPGKVIMAKD
ncbi:amidohydrolase family protein [Clostridium oryzae]|uniref:D-aminoacylase n=1 Tax=Clostridium oryzae TaxID=1450648 RepID=A0A1V4I875_9CLOT|nr:amidohydrolase family protein [Clostridium oryzae]OPJ56182.1 D-aminoacylase [Clostridium oryzae]